MYQLYAYGTKYEKCKKLFLIYPGNESDKNYCYNFFKNENKLSLKILFFDLSDKDHCEFYKNFENLTQRCQDETV